MNVGTAALGCPGAKLRSFSSPNADGQQTALREKPPQVQSRRVTTGAAFIGGKPHRIGNNFYCSNVSKNDIQPYWSDYRLSPIELPVLKTRVKGAENALAAFPRRRAVAWYDVTPISSLPSALRGHILRTILIVDDSPLIRRLVRSYLDDNQEWQLCGEAANGREGVEKALQLHPDLIVMDLSMPVMNGIEAAIALRGLMPAVPVIIFSEFSSVLSGEEARAAGISALVSKEENLSVLLGKARALVQ